MYYSFIYQNSHFILLDSSEGAKWGYISPDQFNWLKNDLLKNKSKNIYVFLHFPLWDKSKSRTRRKYVDFWMNEVMPLFKSFNVRAIFAGHMHSYGPTQEIDGIKCYITGGGGAELNRWYRDFGGRHHFILVDVKDDIANVRVITKDSSMSDEEADVSKNHIFEEENTGHAKINYENIIAARRDSVEIKLHNPYTYNLAGDAQWSYDSNVYRIKPEKLKISLVPGQTKFYHFDINLQNTNIDLSNYPKLEFNLTHDLVFTKDLVFKKHYIIRRMKKRLTIDGMLDEWKSVKPIALYDDDKKNLADYYLSYNDKYFYMGIVIFNKTLKKGKDELIFNDAVILALDKNNRELSDENDDTQMEFIHTGGKYVVYDRIKGKELDMGKNGIVFNITQSGGNLIYEIAIPQKVIEPLELKKGREFGFNIALVTMNENRELISLTPGIGYISVDESFESQLHFAKGKFE